MESGDALLGGLASGDTIESGMKRDQDSTDDFEHLERDSKPGESPLHQHRSVTQSFLDMERGPALAATDKLSGGHITDKPVDHVADKPVDHIADKPVDHIADKLLDHIPEKLPDHIPEKLPDHIPEKLPDHIADKFTDSESDADTGGESPLHRPVPKGATPVPSAPTPEPPQVPDLTPVLAPTPAPLPTPAPVAPTRTPEPAAPVPAPTAPAAAAVPSAPSHLEKQDKPEVKPAPVPVKEPEPEVKPKPVDPEPSPPVHHIAHVIEAEVIFCQMGLDTWFDPQRLHPKVESLIYWRSAARSGAALGAGLALLVALACCSVVSVLAYSSLLVLSAAVAFRIYKNVLQAVQKTNDGHPFKWLLEKDIRVPAERAQSLAAAATAHFNALIHELRSLFLVEDLVDSLKFGVMLWCGTYLGACFNGITLIILGWIALFTLPKAYEMNKEQVDANLELARSKINEISAKVRAAVPLGRKSEADKDK